jgi:hypothetical protein
MFRTSKQEQLHDRHQDDQNQRAWVAEDLDEFLTDDGK